MKVLKFLTILLLVLFPFGELLRFSIGNNIYIRPIDLVACAITGWLLIFLFRENKLKEKIHVSLILFPAIGLVSLALNNQSLNLNELLASSLYAVRWIAYLGVLVTVLLFNPLFKRKLLFILFFGGLYIVVFGFMQYTFYSDLRGIVFMGWDDHMHRLFSTFYDPNFAGVFFVLYFLFVAGLLHKYLQKRKKRECIVLSVALALTLIALLLTFSRSALVMLIVGSITMLILLHQKKLILGLFAVLLGYVIVISPLSYIENTNLLRVASIGGRLETYQNAIAIYQDHPVLGIGFNAYRYVQQDYGFRQEVLKVPSNADAGVDNSFLFVLTTTGIIGFAAFLYFWANLITQAMHQLRLKKNIFAIIFLSSTCGLFVNAFFINSLFFPTIVLWMWMIFATIDSEI